ncbi:MAG: DUF6129 family protein [Chromatiaceae bacterium]|jgi:hypothetical protein|nr:DUF6129 family protein [Chromatiaceae bacterium]
MIRPERLDQVARIVERAGLDEQTVGALREAFTDMHLTYCMDDDIGIVEPVVRAEGFNMYLVDGRGHCMRFTNELETATGIVLAEVDEVGDE